MRINMISAGKVTRILFYIIIMLLLVKGGMIVYYNFVSKNSWDNEPKLPHVQELSFKFEVSSSSNGTDKDTGGGADENYNFKRMLSLIDACEKVKYLENLQFSRPGQIEQIDTATLKLLSSALKHERKSLRRFIWQLRAHSRHSIPSKRMRALKYYMRVIELNTQDIEEIIFMRGGDVAIRAPGAKRKKDS